MRSEQRLPVHLEPLPPGFPGSGIDRHLLPPVGAGVQSSNRSLLWNWYSEPVRLCAENGRITTRRCIQG